MNDLRPLLSDPDASESERLLLEAWKVEQPPEGGRAKTLAALGIVSSTAGASAIVASVAPKAIAATLSLSKWLTICVLAITVAVVTVALVHATTQRAPNQPVAQPPVPVPTKPAGDADVATAVAIDNRASIAAPIASTPVKHRKPREAGGTTDSLGAQIAAIDSVRTALAARDSKRAQRLARSYQEQFPNGAFLEEAETLQIAALDQAGDHAKASDLATEFLARYPSSIYAMRVRSFVTEANP